MISGCEKRYTADNIDTDSVEYREYVADFIDGPKEGDTFTNWYMSRTPQHKQVYFSLVMSGIDTSTITISDHLRSYPYVVREWIYNDYDKEVHQMLEEMSDFYLIELEDSYYDMEYRMRTIPDCSENIKCAWRPPYTKKDIIYKWKMTQFDRKDNN